MWDKEEPIQVSAYCSPFALFSMQAHRREHSFASKSYPVLNLSNEMRAAKAQ